MTAGGHSPDVPEIAEALIAVRPRNLAKGGSAAGSKVLQRAQKCPETAGSEREYFQNLCKNFNALARNSLGYRYTIPQWSQLLKGRFGSSCEGPTQIPAQSVRPSTR
jgi:hypothetical protein